MKCELSVCISVLMFLRKPLIVGGLAAVGIALFSGSCYAVALKQDRSFGKFAPYGTLMGTIVTNCNLICRYALAHMYVSVRQGNNKLLPVLAPDHSRLATD